MTNFLASLKRWLPSSARSRIDRARLALRRHRDSRRPAAQVFDDIYASGAWGGSRDEPCSGAGSRGPVVDAYLDALTEHLRAIGARSIVDIGCGDFNVGRQMLDRLGDNVRYTGIDVSRIVIERNQRLHARPGVDFICADACAEVLPPADVCLVRQVLQHLSNAQILAICARLARYPHVVVTEHHPSGEFTPNKDKPHGADTRLVDGSGVRLDLPPFDVAGLRPLFEMAAKDGDPSWGRLVTVAITNSTEPS